MNGQPPISSETLASLARGPHSRVVVRLDKWANGDSINVSILRRKDDGTWHARRSVTFYEVELENVAAALHLAKSILDGRAA